MPGSVFVFEGVDRSGKSTQAAKLVDKMQAAGIPCEYIKFPNRDTPIGKLINRFLQNEIEVHPMSAALLFAANRWEMHEYMRAKIESDVTLVLDRYVHSGVVYSHVSGDLPINWCKDINKGLLFPNTTVFYLRLPDIAWVQARSGFGEERYERVDVLERAQTLFDEFCSSENWIEINAAEPVETIATKVFEIARR